MAFEFNSISNKKIYASQMSWFNAVLVVLDGRAGQLSVCHARASRNEVKHNLSIRESEMSSHNCGTQGVGWPAHWPATALPLGTPEPH